MPTVNLSLTANGVVQYVTLIAPVAGYQTMLTFGEVEWNGEAAGTGAGVLVVASDANGDGFAPIIAAESAPGLSETFSPAQPYPVPAGWYVLGRVNAQATAGGCAFIAIWELE
jgi:hypothetical protein